MASLSDIDTYEKMTAKLFEKFQKKADGIPEVMHRLRFTERGRRPLREYADEFDIVRMHTPIPGYSLAEIFVKQPPEQVVAAVRAYARLTVEAVRRSTGLVCRLRYSHPQQQPPPNEYDPRRPRADPYPEDYSTREK